MTTSLCVRERRTTRRGLLAAVLLLAVLAVAAAVTVRPLQPRDEPLNVAYAVALSEGRLPRIDVAVQPVMPGQRKFLPHFVANHPPGYYALVSLPISVGVSAGRPWTGVVGARLLTAALTLPAVLLVAALARVLTRGRRPDVVVGAAALAATWWVLPLHAGLVHNDGPATVVTAAHVLVAVLLLRDGLRLRWVTGAIALSCVGLLLRLSASTLVAITAAVLVAAALLHPRTTRLRAAAVGAAWALVLLAASAATSGWWWARNLRLYGDVTGTPLIVRMLRWQPDDRPLAAVATDPSVWAELALAAAGHPVQLWSQAAAASWWVAVAVLAVLGLVATAKSAWRRPPSAGRPSARAVAVALLLLVHVASTFAQVVVHVQHGGNPQPRYLLPVMPVLAVAVAVAALERRRGAAVLAGLLTAQVLGTASWTRHFVVRDDGWTEERILVSTAASAAAAVAVVVVTRCVHRLHRQPASRGDGPRPSRSGRQEAAVGSTERSGVALLQPPPLVESAPQGTSPGVGARADLI